MEPLKVENYYLFREGMTLRKKHVEELYGTDVLDLLHPDLIEVTDQYTYQGTKKLKELVPKPIKYDENLFMMGSRDIYTIYKEGKPLKASELNKLPLGHGGKSQIYHAFKSGILKHDTRSYYFDPTGIRKLRAFTIKLERGEA